MRYNNGINPRDAKRIARQKYGERQIEKWWKWSWAKRNKVKFKELARMMYDEDLRRLFNVGKSG